MSPLRFLGSVLASSRRIWGQAARSAMLLHQRTPPGRRRAIAAAALVGFGGMSLYNIKARKAVHDRQALEDETPEGRAMRKRFEEWIVKYDRTYKDEEEKARRYRIFRREARLVDEHNARPDRSSTWATNLFADREREEICCCYRNNWLGRLQRWINRW